MRGDDQQTGHMFSYLSPEERVPADHPLRVIRRFTDTALQELSGRFHAMYSDIGRPSIAPEQLLRALILQLLYSIRSERLLIEQLNYNLLFRWFVGLSMDAPVWNHSTFSKNRDRLLAGDVAQAFFAAIVRQASAAGLLSDDHFTVDGTLLEAWASQKSFQRKDQPPADSDDDPRNPTRDFRGEPRRNETHASTTDPDARLYKKARGQAAHLAYLGHLLTENRHGLIVDACATCADGTAEREAALLMLSELPDRGRVTIGADKNFDTRDFVAVARGLGITPHVAQYEAPRRASAIDTRTTRHPGYHRSQRKRKLIEQCFGWMKTIGLARKLRHRGHARVNWVFIFTAAAYNMVRMRRLVTAQG